MHDQKFSDAPLHFLNIFRHFTALARDEIDLARAEITMNVSRAGAGIAMIGIAAIIALVGLNVLAMLAVDLLTTNGMPSWQSALMVGGGLLVVALVLVLLGKSRLQTQALKPKRTLDSIKRDLDQLKEARDV